MLPTKVESTESCAVFEIDGHKISIVGAGEFQELPSGELNRLIVEIERPYTSKSGLKTVPLKLLAIGGRGSIEGIGETRFWLDATRPVKSAIWEKRAGTEFPAVQEMRFHFFFTMEGMPGRVFRSMTPARMRSDNVMAFPPPAGTFYRLMVPVNLEDIAAPGVVVATILTNHAQVPERPRQDPRPELSN